MTADLKSTLLKAFQAKQALAGAGLVLIEGSSAETLREAKAGPPRLCVILQQLDQAKSFWYETTLKKEMSLQVPKVGVPVSNPSYVCLFNGTHAAFVGAVTAGPSVISALARASIALKEVNQELAPAGTTFEERMQRESQVFTSVSNVLKTRHDTVKNSISNVR